MVHCRAQWKVSFRRVSLRPVGWPQANLLCKCCCLRSSKQINSTGKQRLKSLKLDLCGATFREEVFRGPQLRLCDITGPSHARGSAAITQFGQQTDGSHRSTVDRWDQTRVCQKARGNQPSSGACPGVDAWRLLAAHQRGAEGRQTCGSWARP